MAAKIVKKDKMASFLDKLIGQFQVFAPVRAEEGYLFREIRSGDEARLDFYNTLRVPKEFFFPQSETLMEYEGPMQHPKVTSTMKEVERKRLLFGIRPCDLRSFLILDRLFINPDYVDNYYKDKRDNTLVVSYGCNTPLQTCFCTSLGFGPFEGEGADLFMTDLGDAYLLEPLTEAGEPMVADLEDAPAEALEKKEKLAAEAAEFVDGEVPTDLAEKLKGMFDDPVWRRLSEKCLGCGACAYLCPTCHCFDIQDEVVDNKGKRVRNWDSCMFPIFTYHGSGHQPRDQNFQRMRQRLLHKFQYYVENFDVVACVGCGRCILNCPVNMDIRENLKRLASQEAEAVKAAK
jgi:ferredoxin